jgi:hypothetical protein
VVKLPPHTCTPACWRQRVLASRHWSVERVLAAETDTVLRLDGGNCWKVDSRGRQFTSLESIFSRASGGHSELRAEVQAERAGRYRPRAIYGSGGEVDRD